MATDLVGVLIALGLSRTEAVEIWVPMLLYVIGMTGYSIFIFEFYRFIARRDIFPLNLDQYAHGVQRFTNIIKRLLNVVEYLLVFPIITVAAALIFSGFLAFLGGAYTAPELLMVAMVIVTVIRISAHYDESLAQDLAKMLPLALLGIFIVQGGSSISVTDSIALVESIMAQGRTIVYYTLFTVIVEFTMRILGFGLSRLRGSSEEEPSGSDEQGAVS